MAHYAILNENNIVINVIVGKDETDFVEGISNWETYYGGKRTSYNTRGGVHLNGEAPFRKNYAGIGFSYDVQRDAFIPPQPYASWLLNEETCLWEPPIPLPDQRIRFWSWNEDKQNWDFVEANNE
jgi:hypothetical protein